MQSNMFTIILSIGNIVLLLAFLRCSRRFFLNILGAVHVDYHRVSANPRIVPFAFDVHGLGVRSLLV